MKTIIVLIFLLLAMQAYAGLVPYKTSKGKRDFVQLQAVASLTVGSCPDTPDTRVTITQYSSVSCSPDESTNNVFVFYTCSGGTLTLFNALDGSGNAYSGSYIISGYSFGTASVLTSPSGGYAGFYSASLTCSADYCGNKYVSSCSTPLASSDSKNDPIFVLTSGGCTTVDFCRGGTSSPTCCSGVTTANCPASFKQCPEGTYNPCPACTLCQGPILDSGIVGGPNNCFPDADGINNYCAPQGYCSSSATITCTSDSDCPSSQFCMASSGCYGKPYCWPLSVGCSGKRQFLSSNTSLVVPKPIGRDEYFLCSQCPSGKCLLNCMVGSVGNCCIPQ